MNKHMLRESWLVEHKPAIYWPMLETAENVARRYGISREAQDEYGARSQQRAAAAAAAHKFDAEIVPLTVTTGVADRESNRIYTRETTLASDEGIRADTTYEAVAKIKPALPGGVVAAGNDVGWYIRKRRYVEKPDVVYSRIADRLCELGRFGQKTRLGWYRYESGRRDALTDPAVDALIASYRTEHGMTPRKIADREIVDRCIYALVNEGARILEDGIALRASDIDVVYLTGYGFPLYRGGPMHYADTVGLFNVIRAMRRFAAFGRGDPAFWQPAPLLARLAAEGKTFNMPS
jgi:3-hydroxyacyl-CoA dehydrogenase